MDTNFRILEPTFLEADLSAEKLNMAFTNSLSSDTFGITVPSFWVKKAVRDLEKKDIMVSTVVGYPYGFNQTLVRETPG